MYPAPDPDVIASDAREPRVVALDWLRGIVMVLMAVDHASMAFNSGRLAQDSAATYTPGTALALEQFATRWISHLCAPTFLFLAGAAIAFSVASRAARGESARQIDRFLLVRGLLIALLDPVVVSLGSPLIVLQVLYAIGVGLILMVPLRRLPVAYLLALGLAWMVGGEFVTRWVWSSETPLPHWAGLTIAPYSDRYFYVLYPVVPWLAILLLGFTFGRYLLRWRAGNSGLASPTRLLLWWSLGAIAVFALVRGFDGYGNMLLHRDDGSLVQWLHVSKYPPSLTFVSLELGIMASLLAGLLWLEPRVRVRANGVLLVLGQTALFFYVAHRFVFSAVARGFPRLRDGGLVETYVAAAGVCLLLYPLCLAYRSYKRAHPMSLARFF